MWLARCGLWVQRLLQMGERVGVKIGKWVKRGSRCAGMMTHTKAAAGRAEGRGGEREEVL